MKKILLTAFVVLLVGCTHNDEDFKKHMEREGVTIAYKTGYKYFSCSEDDFVKTGFTGYKNGVKVEGVICDTLFFKGATVRYF